MITVVPAGLKVLATVPVQRPTRPSGRIGRRQRVLCAAVGLVALCVLVPAPATAHEVRPGYLELRESAPGVFRVLWKKPARGDLILKIDPVFSAGCVVAGIGSGDVRGGAYVARATLECDGGIRGETIEIAGLESTLTDVLVRIYYADGQQETLLVQPNDTTAVIGGPSGAFERIVAYTWLGTEHIALGVDHLLFVLGLLLSVSGRTMLLKTVTAFTLAHSVTLGIATLSPPSASGELSAWSTSSTISSTRGRSLLCRSSSTARSPQT